MRAAREAAKAERSKVEAHTYELRCAYAQYRSAEVDRYIEATYTSEQLALMVDQEKEQLLGNKRFNFAQWPAEKFQQYAEQLVRGAVSEAVSVPSFQEYVDATKGGALS